MHTYRVIENWHDDQLLGLRCSLGRYHLARALQLLPQVDARLHGARPHLGFGVLLCPNSGAVFRVIFEVINQADPVLGAQGKPGGPGGLHERSAQPLR